jgi:DNA invertase Pin-like site-specific DNA recombinase
MIVFSPGQGVNTAKRNNPSIFPAWALEQQPVDVLVVTRLDRLARSTPDLLNVLASVTERGAGFRSLKDTWADTTPHGRLMLTMLGGLAEFERELISARSGEGRECAKKDGVRVRAPAQNDRSPTAGSPATIAYRRIYPGPCSHFRRGSGDRVQAGARS